MKLSNVTVIKGKRRMAHSNLLQLKSLMKEASQKWQSHPTCSVEKKAIALMKSKVADMERRLGLMQTLEPDLDNLTMELEAALDIGGMTGKRRMAQIKEVMLIQH